MGKTLKRFVTRTVLLLVAVLAAYGGWMWGDRLFPRVEAMLGMGRVEVTDLPVSAETAARATARIEEFQSSGEPVLRLESTEVSSLLRYSVPGMVPAGVLDPIVVFEGDRMDIRARVLPAGYSDLPQLSGIAGLLPDTVDVVVEGSLTLFENGGSIFMVEGIEVQGWPIPSRAVPEILGALGQKPPPGAPASAVRVPVLRGIRGAYVEGGELVVVRDQTVEEPGSWQES